MGEPSEVNSFPRAPVGHIRVLWVPLCSPHLDNIATPPPALIHRNLARTRSPNSRTEPTLPLSRGLGSVPEMPLIGSFSLTLNLSVRIECGIFRGRAMMQDDIITSFWSIRFTWMFNRLVKDYGCTPTVPRALFWAQRTQGTKPRHAPGLKQSSGRNKS